MKKIFTLLTLITSTASAYTQTCFVNTSSSSASVCEGESMTITADHGFTFPNNQFFDFNQNQLPPGWGTTGGANFANNTCGMHPDGTPYFWASTAVGTPQIITADFDICTGGTLQFDMKYAIQGVQNPAGCEGPDEQDEGVSIQYSLDGGVTWVEFVYFRPDGVQLPANPGGNNSIANGNTPYTNWSTFNIPIPAAAISSSTRFRWIQTQSSGGCCDNWGLDNIGVLAGACIATNLVWSNGLTNVDDFTFNATSDTCFTASLYDTNNNFLCSDQICVQVNPNFTSSFNATICNGDTYMWGSNSSALLPYTASGNYPATFTSVSGCDSTVTLNLTVNPIFNSSINASICNGDQYTFAGNNYTTAGNYPVVFQSVGGCDSTVTINLTVNPIPVTDAVAPQTFCNGTPSTVIPITSSVPGTTFAWTNDNTATGFPANGAGDVGSVNVTNTGNAPITSTFTVTPTANTCVGVSTTFTVTINPTPNVNAVQDQTLCNGLQTNAVAFTGSVNNTTFDWTNTNTNIGLGAAGNGPIGSFTATNTGNTAISSVITVTPTANGCVGPVTTFNINVEPTPTTDAIVDQIVCNGANTLGINFNGPVTGTTFDWTNDNISIGLAANGSGDIASFAATNNGNTAVTATVTITPTANTCVGLPTTTAITVNPTPTVNVVAPQVICNGDASAAIGFSGNVANTTFDWVNDNTTIGLGANGTGNIGVFNTVNTGSSPIISTVTVTPSANNCVGLAEVFQITVNPTHVGTPVSNTICDGDTLIFGTGSFTSTGSYPVVFQNAYGCDSTVTLNLLVHPVYSGLKDTTFCDGYVYSYGGQTFTNAGVYPVMFQTINGCDSLITLTITVTPAPIPFAGNDLVLCSDQVGNLGGAPFLGTTIYTWTGGPGLSDYNIAQPTVSVNSLIPIMYTYVIESDNEGCVAYDSVQVRIVPYPVVNIPPVAPQCFQGNNFDFTAGNNFNQTDVFAWSFSNANMATSSQVAPVGVSFLGAGTHQVSVVVTNEMCPSYDTLQVVVYGEPVAALAPLPATGCIPLSVQFQNNSTPAGVTSQWSLGNGQFSTNNAPATIYTEVGSFTVSLVVTTADGCVDTAVYNSLITTYPLPEAGFTAVPEVLYMDDPYVSVSDNASNAVTWTYNISSGGQYQTPGFYHQFADTGYHQITQVVTNSFGCSDQIVQLVYVRPASSIYVPNAFTPNIDDINSTFGAYGNEIFEFHMRIHDRWGEKMFDSRDINLQWDGTRNGKPVKQDVYVYKIDYVDHRGNKQELMGRVTLIR